MKSAELSLMTAVMSALSSGRPTLSWAIFSFTMATSASATLSITITICAPRSRAPAVNANCTALSLIPSVNGHTVRSFSTYARTTVRSERKPNHCLAL
jgi:hypothetical protein